MKRQPNLEPQATEQLVRPTPERIGPRFDLRSLFLVFGFLATALAAISWRQGAWSSALFVLGVSALGIVATLCRSLRLANILIFVMASSFLFIICALLGTAWLR